MFDKSCGYARVNGVGLENAFCYHRSGPDNCTVSNFNPGKNNYTGANPNV